MLILQVPIDNIFELKELCFELSGAAISVEWRAVSSHRTPGLSKGRMRLISKCCEDLLAPRKNRMAACETEQSFRWYLQHRHELAAGQRAFDRPFPME
ncbi:MAG: hypothetical protein JWM11_6106 [Planctomycetaceae bacterium]|nr:hypothetical protein [Planctomycetaceae bacterium]